MSDFFEKDEATEVEKIKLGDQEFDPQELQELVNLGKIGKEVEEKYNTKIDKVYPEYTKVTQKVKELEGADTELQELKAKMAELEAQGNSEWTPEAREKAQKQLIDLMGGKPVTDKELESWYQNRKTQDENVQNLLKDVDQVLAEVKAEGKPPVEKKDLLEYMQEHDYRRPATAYKEMKEAELDAWRSSKLEAGKRPGLHTITSSQAGGKQPENVRPTMDNLSALTREALGQAE